ncbi:deoxyribonuclease TATDN1-like [Ornithodoros turicata]|uniref:deoxyribonuclease TATDN1-like n=1 Tax=Ornithodoros turicata TaxID=34597 RepID=UPI003138B393
MDMTAVAAVAGTVRRRLIDIGANLTDPMFRGLYNGSQKHVDDLQEVLKRASANGVQRILVTGGSLEDSQQALTLAQTNDMLYSTVGCHPTRCGEIETVGEENYIRQLQLMALQNPKKVVAVGEFGLDYERLEFCNKETQLRYFEAQLTLSETTGLPLFLHCRKAAADLVAILRRNSQRFHAGVVHSFDGTPEEAAAILDLGLHIGINGCSLKTRENLQVVAALPADRLLIETDSPWCEIRPTHAGAKLVRTTFPCKKKERFEPGFQVKGRNEPANIVQVLEVLAGARNEDADVLAERVYRNTLQLFFPDEAPS